MPDKQCFRTSIGGQALIEGVMMRGPKKQAIVVRTKEGLVSKVEDVKLLKEKYPVVGWPVIRGAVNFVSSMSNGVRALMYSAEFMEEEPAPEKKDKPKSERSDKLLVTMSVILGIALSVGLFILLPTLLTGWLARFIEPPVLKNLAEGALRIIIFLVYLWLATKLKEMKRVWAYHGAEHKTIFCYERGLALTVENARPMPRQHPRCGTSFLFIVMIVSILVFSLVSWSNVYVRIALRLLLLPVVVGISYELIKLAGRYDNLVTRIISAPGKALQRLTTREPDDDMLEVAIESMKLVAPQDEGEAAW